MLDRVGSWSMAQGLINEYGRIQSRTVNWQTQISTGKVGDQFADVKDKASVLVAAKQKFAETGSYLSATKEVLNRLDVQDLHLRELVDISGRLRRKRFSPPQPNGYEGLMFPPEQSSKYVRTM